MRWLFAAVLAASPAFADEDTFVTANLRAIFYHELGHAIIDVENLPVFGQEEDAADVASILLIDAFFDEETATEIAYETAFGFLAEDELRKADGEDVAWWDTHGPDLQRFYTLVCLFTGADMDERADIAEDLGLPEDRMDSCEDEFDLANDSWGPVFDDLSITTPGDTFRFAERDTSLTSKIIAEETQALNESFALSTPIEIKVESCGEPNAFYDLDAREIIMCTEFEDWLRKAYAVTAN